MSGADVRGPTCAKAPHNQRSDVVLSDGGEGPSAIKGEESPKNKDGSHHIKAMLKLARP